MASLSVSLLCPPSRAAIDAQLNTSNFVSGQASELSIDGVITAGGPSTSITGAAFTISFDPAEVTLSGFRAGTGWSLQNTNTDDLSQGWVKAVLSNTSSDGAGQTSTGPILYFTVTPANGQVDPGDCGTLRFAGVDSDLADQEYVTVYPSDPCAGRMAPLGRSGTTGTKGGRGSDGPMTSEAFVPDIQSVVRILKIAAGFVEAEQTGNPNELRYTDPDEPGLDPNDPRLFNGYYLRYKPLTQQDHATLEAADSRFWLAPCPDGGCENGRTDPTYRSITIADAVRSAQMAYRGPSDAIWGLAFVGNYLEPSGFAANAVGAPAVADIDGDDVLDVVFPMGTINGRNYADPTRDQPGNPSTSNPNRVYAMEYATNIRSYALDTAHWPQPVRDAPAGISVADLYGDSDLEIIAPCFQDSFRKDTGKRYPELYSRPYVWDHEGGDTGIMAHSSSPDRGTDNQQGTIDATYPRGVVRGHSGAPPPVWDLDGDETKDIVFAGIGYREGEFYTPHYSNIQGVRTSDGGRVFETQRTNKDAPWYTGPTSGPRQEPLDTAFETAPILVRSDPADADAPRYVAAASFLGLLYAWRTDAVHEGERLGLFPFQTPVPTGGYFPAAFMTSIASGDVDLDGHSEIIAGTGYYLNYAGDAIAHFNDGAVYCWGDDGNTKWRYPATGWLPSIMSGIAIGRVNGSENAPCVVAVDASGTVVALDGDTGQPLWTFEIEENPAHRYFHGAVAQPLILDVNGDDFQDVVVGTTAGFIYLLDGNPDATQRKIWKSHTPLSADSVWRPHGNAQSDDFVIESQYEEVRGLAVGPLNTATPERAILFVSCSRAGLTLPVQQVGGHVLLFDLSAARNPVTLPRTWYEEAADWTQYQGGAARLGCYPDR